MFNSNVKLGIAPIAWTNDDMPDLGKENTFEQCISEMALAGFKGSEVGNKYPRDVEVLKKALELRDMEIASAWFSAFLTTKPYEETEKAFIEHRDFLNAMGAKVIVVSEQGHSIQGQMETPIFDGKYVLNEEEWKTLAEGLNKLGALAKEKGMNIHQYLTEKASKLKVGESGLMALDWWNGNRSVLVDVDLTGVMIVMTLLTKPEEMYRALIEATAYGTRKIIETFEQNGVPVDEFYAAGGIAEKNAMMMQIYADVIKKPIRISGSLQGPALGSAIFGTVAAGSKNGGYDSVFEASQVIGKLKDTVYRPNPENSAIYDKLYQEYSILHDYFGRGTNDVLKRLKDIKKEAKELAEEKKGECEGHSFSVEDKCLTKVEQNIKEA